MTEFLEQKSPSLRGYRKSVAPWSLARSSGQAASAVSAVRRLIVEEALQGGTRQARDLAWRALRSPATTLDWLRTLDRLGQITAVTAAPHHLARKPARAYLRHGLSYSAKITLLTQHYGQLLAVLGPSITGKLLAGRTYALAEFEGAAAAGYQLTLAQSACADGEGEIVVELVRLDDDRRLASLSLVIGALEASGSPDLWIGGLQDGEAEERGRLIAQTCVDLWGLRPRDLLIHAVYALKARLGAGRLKAIASEGHIDHWPEARVLRRRAGYDGFWREWGGRLVEGDVFILPDVHPSPLEDTPAAERQHAALRDTISAQIRGISD